MKTVVDVQGYLKEAQADLENVHWEARLAASRVAQACEALEQLAEIVVDDEDEDGATYVQVYRNGVKVGGPVKVADDSFKPEDFEVAPEDKPLFRAMQKVVDWLMVVGETDDGWPRSLEYRADDKMWYLNGGGRGHVAAAHSLVEMAHVIAGPDESDPETELEQAMAKLEKDVKVSAGCVRNDVLLRAIEAWRKWRAKAECSGAGV